MDPQVWDQFTHLKMDHMRDRDGANNYSCFNIEGCRDCNYVFGSRNCFSCHNCDSCMECISCVDCKNCTLCVGLKEAQYQILNIQYDEASYYARLKELGIDPEVDTY
jgi:hypothetical protein